MADKAIVDKAISDLTQALQITNEDLFVLEQSGEAKKLKGSQVVQYAKDSVAAEVQGVKAYADSAKASADAAAKDATRAETAAQGIDDKVSAADASAKAAASSAAAAAASATGVDEKVQAAQTAAANAAQSETAAKDAQTAAANAQKAAESAQTGAQAAKTAAESAQEAAESAKDAAADSSTAAGQKASQAAQSAEDAAFAKSAAKTAKTDAQAARDAIVNMIVEAITLASGSDATVSKSVVDNVFKLAFGIPRGNPGADAPTITGITIRQSDYHMIVSLSDGTTYDAGYCRGAAGAGSGDMIAAVYDPQGKQLDIYKYVDDMFSNIPAANVKFSDGTTFQQKLDSGVLKGDPGKDGAKGADGLPGKDGADGAPGKDGTNGRDGVTFTPAMSAAGDLSWTNDGGLANPETVNLKGPKGDTGAKGEPGAKGDPGEKGADGLPGKDGAKGDKGDKGDTGPAGPVNVPVTTSLIKGNGSGGLAAATAGTDYALRPTTRKVTLTASGWNSSTKQQTVTCSGVLSDATKQLLIPTPVNTAAGNPYDEASIQMVAQGANSVTFYADTVPTVSIDVYVTIYPINYLG